MKKLDAYKAVSFDIFDTLIRRIVAEPSDVFRLVAEKLFSTEAEQKDFYEKRLAAKEKARNRSRTYNIDDVYELIDLSEEMKDKAKDSEKKVEISVCVPNDKVLEIFNKIKDEGKIIYLISDMYLDRDTIQAILDQAGISGYKKLYISQEEGCEKLRGELYRRVLNENGIKASELFHIGDNLKSDIMSAKLVGINTYRIQGNFNELDYHSYRGLNAEERHDYRLILENLIGKKVKCEDTWTWVGYSCLGPVLWGFSNWLMKELTINGIKRVFFLAREGELLKKAFEILYKDAFTTEYLYVSRKSLTVPSFASDSTYEGVVKKISFPKHITMSDFVTYLGLEGEVDVISDQGMVIEGWSVVDNQDLKNIYNSVRNRAEEHYKSQNSLVRSYLINKGVFGKVAIIDVGWNGTMQMALENLCNLSNVDIYGFYFGVNERNKLSKTSKAKGYIYEPRRNTDYQYYIMGMSGPLEMMMTAHHGTTSGYEMKNDIVVPVLEDSEYFGRTIKPEAEAIEKMQDGAIRYVQDMSRNSYLAHHNISGKAAFHNFLQLGGNPSKVHRQMFYGMKEYDGTVELVMLAPGLRSLKNIKDGFWNSSWKIGYMKDKVKLPLPYKDIYKMMRKRK